MESHQILSKPLKALVHQLSVIHISTKFAEAFKDPKSTPITLVNLEGKSIGYQLPFRQNRGKPPNRYSPDIGRTSKYPVANHVSTEKLSKPLKAFVHQLSAIHISPKFAEAFKDPKWVQDIKKETKAIEKNQTWTLETLPQGKKTVGS
ncbi:unnamed protein product [Prunus armeniaca]